MLMFHFNVVFELLAPESRVFHIDAYDSHRNKLKSLLYIGKKVACYRTNKISRRAKKHR